MVNCIYWDKHELTSLCHVPCHADVCYNIAWKVFKKCGKRKFFLLCVCVIHQIVDLKAEQKENLP